MTNQLKQAVEAVLAGWGDARGLYRLVDDLRAAHEAHDYDGLSYPVGPDRCHVYMTHPDTGDGVPCGALLPCGEHDGRKDRQFAAQQQREEISRWIERAEKADAEVERLRGVLESKHGGEPTALLAELDEARAEVERLRKERDEARGIARKACEASGNDRAEMLKLRAGFTSYVGMEDESAETLKREGAREALERVRTHWYADEEEPSGGYYKVTLARMDSILADYAEPSAEDIIDNVMDPDGDGSVEPGKMLSPYPPPLVMTNDREGDDVLRELDYDIEQHEVETDPEAWRGKVEYTLRTIRRALGGAKR